MSGMLLTDPQFGYDPDPGIHYDGETDRHTEIPVPRPATSGNTTPASEMPSLGEAWFLLS